MGYCFLPQHARGGAGDCDAIPLWVYSIDCSYSSFSELDGQSDERALLIWLEVCGRAAMTRRGVTPCASMLDSLVLRGRSKIARLKKDPSNVFYLSPFSRYHTDSRGCNVIVLTPQTVRNLVSDGRFELFLIQLVKALDCFQSSAESRQSMTLAFQFEIQPAKCNWSGQDF